MRITFPEHPVDHSILRRLVLIMLATFVSGTCFGSGDPEYVAICDLCVSEESFAQVAVQQVPDPGPGEGQVRFYPVYVVNPSRNRVEFFNVVVQRYDGGISTSSASGYEFGLYKTAYPAEADPVVETAVLDAALIAEAFAGELNDNVRADDISAIGSAIDLLGPNGTLASRNRNQIRMDLNDHYNSMWNRQSLNFSDTTSRLAGKLLGSDSIFTIDGSITVEFEDGTTIILTIDNINEVFDADEPFFFELSVEQYTARLPDGSMIPQDAGEFAGFVWSDNSAAGPSLAQRLARLATRYGLAVGDSGEALDCTMECDGQGHCVLDCGS